MSRHRRTWAGLLVAFASSLGASERIELVLDVSQAEAALAIAGRQAAGEAVPEHAWEELFATEPYVRLAKREASLGRPFTEEAFREFASSAALAARLPALRQTLAVWRQVDLAGAAARLLPYLPSEARIRAKVYPVVKPRSNSFVFETTTDPAIFLYLDAQKSDAEFANTVAHELHHIGLASVASGFERRIEALPPGARQAAGWMGAFGEGLAVLAAAGSSEGHPLAAFPAADRSRWDQDQEAFDQLLSQLDQFFLDLVDGGYARPEVADRVAFTFFGYRGPWYTVGYRMGAMVERHLGRAELIEGMRDPRRLLVSYNRVAERENAKSAAKLPLWSPRLLAAVAAPSGPQGGRP